VSVLNRFTALESCLEDELNAVETIRDCTVYLDLTEDQVAFRSHAYAMCCVLCVLCAACVRACV
jgi:hypothetical protein